MSRHKGGSVGHGLIPLCDNCNICPWMFFIGTIIFLGVIIFIEVSK